MKQKKIKNKILTSLIYKGKKSISEKMFLKSLKKLHTITKKQFQKIIKLFLISAISIFNLYKLKNKRIKKNKEIFKILKTNSAWIFVAIKLISKYLKFKKLKNNYVQFCKELYLNSKNERQVITKKIIIQKKISLKKKNFYYYRW